MLRARERREEKRSGAEKVASACEARNVIGGALEGVSRTLVRVRPDAAMFEKRVL